MATNADQWKHDVKYVFSRCHPTPCGDREYSATISSDLHMSTTTTAFQGNGPSGGPGASVTILYI